MAYLSDAYVEITAEQVHAVVHPVLQIPVYSKEYDYLIFM
jgi:hypothetical protein